MKKSDAAKATIDAAIAAYQEFGFNPYLVAAMHQFGSDFFENTPKAFAFNIYCIYLRDPAYHSAIVYNAKTGAIQLVDKKRYWTKATIKDYKFEAKKAFEKIPKKLKNNKQWKMK